MTNRPILPSPIPIRPAALGLALMIGHFLPVASGQDDLGPLPSDPRFQALSTDGKLITGRIRSLDPDGSVSLVVEGGVEERIAAETLVKLAREGRDPIGDELDSAVLIFPGFETLRGMIDSADERSIALRSPVLGEMQVPLDVVLGFTTGPPSAARSEDRTIAQLRDPSRTSDLLLLENGDRREITFSAMTDAEVSYLDSDRALKLPRRTVRAIALDPGLVRLPEVESSSIDLILTEGSRLRLLEPRIADGRLSGRSTFGSEIEVGLEHVSELYVLVDSIAYLSDLEAAREVTVPYIGPGRPMEPDGSVLGGPLVVGGREYVRGLGTQSRSLLAYRLGPEDRRFQAMVAMDDAAGPRGNVVFRVLVDSEERFSSPPMSVGVEPIPVDVDLSGGQFLILATEFGRGGGVRDFAAWIEARLIRGPVPEDRRPESGNAGN